MDRLDNYLLFGIYKYAPIELLSINYPNINEFKKFMCYYEIKKYIMKFGRTLECMKAFAYNDNVEGIKELCEINTTDDIVKYAICGCSYNVLEYLCGHNVTLTEDMLYLSLDIGDKKLIDFVLAKLKLEHLKEEGWYKAYIKNNRKIPYDELVRCCCCGTQWKHVEVYDEMSVYALLTGNIKLLLRCQQNNTMYTSDIINELFAQRSYSWKRANKCFKIYNDEKKFNIIDDVQFIIDILEEDNAELLSFCIENKIIQINDVKKFIVSNYNYLTNAFECTNYLKKYDIQFPIPSSDSLVVRGGGCGIVGRLCTGWKCDYELVHKINKSTAFLWYANFEKYCIEDTPF